MIQFLRFEGNYNIYLYRCPKCGGSGEMGFPRNNTKLVDHGCGAMFIQKPTTGKGLYDYPRIEVITNEENN